MDRVENVLNLILLTMIRQFTSYLENIKGYSENTARAYGKDLTRFAKWVRVNHPCERWSTITRDLIDEYITERAEKGLSPETTNRELASISGIYRYFIRQGWLTKNPCRYQSRRKQGQHLPSVIPLEELKAGYNNSYGVTRIWIGLLMTTGIRISELLALEWSDFDFKACSIEIHGKGNKDRIVFSTPEVLEPLRKMAEFRPRSGRLWIRDARDVRYIIHEALKGFSSAKQLSPHAIRHTMATELARQGANVTTLAKLLGHNQLATTQKYINMACIDTRQAMCNYKII